MDDLFALVEDDDNPMIQNDDDATLESQPEVAHSLSETSSKTLQEKLASSMDTKIGLRIINRKISGAEMMDIMSGSTYRSPAVLSAMSLDDLNNHILTEPTMVVDASTVCGRTNFCSVGIVFSNSGTRTSSTGNAFCALTIGNFVTGPAIGILLFGTAYSKYVRTLQPGKVVLLENPRLIPSKKSNRNETSITFSVNNEKEIQLVGDAQDFGICKGTVRGMNENGKWVDNAKRCRAYVDTRQCLYCKLHRQQSNVVDKSGNKMDKLRNEAKGSLSQTRFPVNRAGLLHNVQQHQQQQSMSTTVRTMMQSAARPSVSSNIRAYHHSETNPRQQSKTSNPLLQDYSVKKTITNPLQTPSISRNIQVPPKVTPLPKRKHAPPLLIKNTPLYPKKADQELLEKITGVKSTNTHTTPKNPNKRKLTSVNTDIGHFDGQVPVPKAKQFIPLDRERLTQFHNPHQVPKPQLEVGTKSQSDILLRQKQVAEQLRHQVVQKNQSMPRPQANHLHSKKQSIPFQKQQQTNRNDFFGTLSMGKEEVERIMAAKSRFADEANAEEYARALHAVSELEKEEYKITSKEKKQQQKTTNHQSSSSIQTKYFCLHCKRTYAVFPQQCQRMQHRIRTERQIQAIKTTAEKRLDLTRKGVEDGGIVLAQGLEWDR